jgi:Flp pilus assembly protein TadG
VNRKREKRKEERGKANLELALSVPFLVLIIFAIADVHRWVNLHLTASRIAFEAARYAASLPNLEIATNSATVGNHGAVSGINQMQVYDRISQLVIRQNNAKPMSDPAVMTLTHTDGTAGGGDDNVVLVTVELPFSSFFSAIVPFNSVQATARRAYLFPVRAG